MNKVFKVLSACLIGLLIMELVAKFLFPDVPDVGRMVVDSLYKSPDVSSKLG